VRRRHTGLWPTLVSFPNLLRAAVKAARGKRGQENVARFHFDLERQLCRLQDELTRRTYVPGPYRVFTIREPKPRLISAAPFRDRVVHHALCNVLEPIFERAFIGDSYASRRGKGTHAAVDRFTAFARRHRYVLQCDVSKYFPSIDHEVLKGLMARKVKDRDVLWLVGRVIDHSNPQEPVQEWFPGDDLFAPSGRRRGLPLGNQTSQFFANVYLDPFDHFVKQTMRVRGYLRYVDDFALFGDDPAGLAEARERCREGLRALRLRLHPRKSVIARVADGSRFLGYRVFPDHWLLPRANVVKMRRRLRRLQAGYAAGVLDWPDVRRGVAGWLGHAGRADTWRLRERLFAEYTFRREG
jgi:retron-type reverse transcriptase